MSHFKKIIAGKRNTINIVQGSKSSETTRTLNNINFYLSTFPAKINDKVFQNEEKSLFWVHCYTKGIFPKNSGYVQQQGSLSI